jgi:hypothetical protein
MSEVENTLQHISRVYDLVQQLNAEVAYLRSCQVTVQLTNFASMSDPLSRLMNVRIVLDVQTETEKA